MEIYNRKKFSTKEKETVRYRNKNIGVIEGDTFITERRPWHYFEQYDGFGISVIVLAYLWQVGIRNVQILYFEDKNTKSYTCNLIRFMESTKEYIYRFEDNGRQIEDRQKFVSIPEMEVHERCLKI